MWFHWVKSAKEIKKRSEYSKARYENDFYGTPAVMAVVGRFYFSARGFWQLQG